jgi:hypothetical protein
MRLLLVLVLLFLSTNPTRVSAGDVPVAAHKTATVPPPPLPPLGDFTVRARVLFDAIVKDDAASALTLFLPREAFRKIKSVAAPDPLYDRLVRAYERDIHALHEGLTDLQHAEFVRVDLSRRRSYVVPGEEANRLPYWAQRHSWLVVRVGQREQRIELRVMIAWEDHWYLTHLSEFRH